MNKKLIPFAALALFSTVAMTSCGAETYETGVDINYVLLIGQIDHNDSAARTRGIREALGTRVDKADQKANPNAEDAKQGKLVIGGKTYRVNELEAMEQKNTSGATWDQQTATSTAQTWINKYANTQWKGADGKVTKKQGITFFVSNNDGMAEGAIGADNWVKGTPIWGYDSNASTLDYVASGDIMGTVNQNAPGQAAAIFMAARNALDKVEPAEVVTKGVTTEGDWGKLTSEYVYKEDQHALLAKNVAVTKENVAEYQKDIAEQVDKGVKLKENAGAKAKVLLTYYSNSDTFLNSSMKPLFKAYKDTFNFDVTELEGDGATEESLFNKVQSSAKQDAYLINMVKTTSTETYLDLLATKHSATKENPTDVPVIFWNRQGTHADNSVDTEVMKDPRFKYIYYVGFDANQGGDVQGQMIKDYLTAHIADLTK